MNDLKDTTRGISSSPAPPVAKKGEKKPARKEWRIKKLGRLAAYCFAVSAIGSVVALRSVYADVQDAAMGMGSELGKLDDVGTKRAIRINGQPVHVMSSYEDVGVTELLDTMERGCKDGSAGLVDVFQSLSAEAKKNLPKDATTSRAAGVLRKDSIGAGVVACLVRDDPAAPTVAEFAGRMGEFARTMDLAAIGKLRYVYATGAENGKTHVVSAWTDGSFDLDALLPKGGDTPGNDSQFAPRPAGAVRLLTADVDGVPYAVRLYDAAGKPESVMQSYDTELSARGWSAIHGDPDAPNARTYSRAGVDLMVFAEPSRDRSVVSIVEYRGK